MMKLFAYWMVLISICAGALATDASGQEPLPPAPLLPPDPFPTIGVPRPDELDFIIHNMGADSPDFRTFRKSNCRMNLHQVHLKIAEHIEDGLYFLISITASKHAYMVICGTQLSIAELEERSRDKMFPGLY